MHYHPPGTTQPLPGQSQSWGCSVQFWCPRFGLIRREKDVVLSPSSVTHQLCHLGQVAIFEPLTWEGGAKGGANIHLILTDYYWEIEKLFKPEPTWAQPGILSLLISMPSGCWAPIMYRALGTHLLFHSSSTCEPRLLPHSTNDKKWLREAKGHVQGHIESDSSPGVSAP